MPFPAIVTIYRWLVVRLVPEEETDVPSVVSISLGLSSPVLTAVPMRSISSVPALQVRVCPLDRVTSLNALSQS